MRVLHVIPAFYPAEAYGGPSDSVYQLCLSLTTGADVRVLSTDANGCSAVLDVNTSGDIDLADGLRARYCRRIARHTVAPGLLRLLPSYVRWADIVHLTAVYSFPTLPTLLLCRALSRPIVWSPRGAFQRWEKSGRVGLKRLWEGCCRVVAPASVTLHVTSEAEAEASLLRFPGHKVCVVPNGVEIPQDVEHVERGKLLRLVYLGRLHPIKGVENLLEACRRLNDDGKRGWSLSIAGTGHADYVGGLARRVGASGFNGQVDLVGDVRGETKRKLFANADVVIVPSFSENFGMVVAEALAHGVPVIASKRTPWKQIEDIGCGLWVDNDAASLAESIVRISSMPLRTLGEKGRAWMTGEFSWSKRAQEMLAVYRRVLGEA